MTHPHQKTWNLTDPTAPFGWAEPCRVRVELDFADFEAMDRVFAVMALSPQHAFHVLAKDTGMAEYLTHLLQFWPDSLFDAEYDRRRPLFEQLEKEDCLDEGVRFGSLSDCPRLDAAVEALEAKFSELEWPLPNVILGVTIRTQADADRLIPDLLRCPAAGRWLDVRPVEVIDLSVSTDSGYWKCYQCGSEQYPIKDSPRCSCPESDWRNEPIVDWVVLTGGDDPLHPDIARSLRDRCEIVGVPFWFSGWGEYAPCETHPVGTAPLSVILIDGEHLTGVGVCDVIRDDSAEIVGRVGPTKSGRLLDGKTHDGLPELKGQSDG